MSVLDEARLRGMLGVPALTRFVERLAVRLARRGELSGSMGLQDATPAERDAIDRLLGRSAPSATLNLGKLDELLRHTRIADSLAAAVAVLAPDVLASHAEVRERKLAWDALETDLERETSSNAPLDRWRANVIRTGLLKRLSRSEPMEARRLFNLAMRVLSRLPARGLLLPVLAADAAGDSHALDSGAPVGTLVVRALSIAAGTSLDDRRALWAAVGVELDALSAPVLVLGIRVVGGGWLADALTAHADAGEPYHLTLRAQRAGLDLSLYADREIHVCENPAIVGLAADSLGAQCRPLVCTSGQPRGAARALITLLADAKALLRYHGDFDWPGIGIANEVMSLARVVPWRFGSSDYLAAPEGPPLGGMRAETPWDPSLADAMEQRGVAVHEEQIASLLVGDLAPRS